MGLIRRSGAWVLVAMSAVVAASCDAVLGIHGAIRVAPAGVDAGATDGASASCGVNAGSQACAACIQKQCCEQAGACAANGACAAYENCLIPCGGDPACRARCFAADHANATEIPEMDQCVAAQCASECGIECGGAGAYVAEPDAAVACQQCLTANACSVAEECATNLECQEFLQCGLECPTYDCLGACTSGRDAGVSAFAAYTLGAESCVGSCDLGSYWDCAPAPVLLSASAQTTLTLIFTVFPSGQPLTNATVKACDLGDIMCATPVVAPGTTDAQGSVTFVLPASGPIGFLGYFDISSPSIYPALYFLESPLTVPEATLPAPILLPSASAITGFYTSYGATLDPSRGIIEIQATDCHWVPALKVTVEADIADAGVGLAYLGTNGFSPTATETDITGYAVLFNAPVSSPVTVSVTPVALGHVASAVTLFARPQSWSFMVVHP